MAFDVPRRIEAKTYEIGDLISLSGLAGEESFDYPYLYVTERYEAKYESGQWFYPPSEIVYPAWSETIQYVWQDYSKSDFERQLVKRDLFYYNYSQNPQWRVWYNGILYEATQWVMPNEGVPPNEQFTNKGDTAGMQVNLRGQVLGYPTILKNESHTFCSWKIAEEQPNNPEWVNSVSMSYLIFNNDFGNDTPASGGEIKYYSDEPSNAHDFDPIINLSLPDRYHYFSTEYSPAVGGWYVRVGEPNSPNPSLWYNELRSSESYYSDTPSTRVYEGFSNYGWNVWTGRMPTLDSVQVNPYDQFNNTLGFELRQKISINLFSQAYVETRRLQNEPVSYDIINQYPNPNKIFISALREFYWDYRIGDEEEPRKDNEGSIDRSGRIIVRHLMGDGAIYSYAVSGLPVTNPNDVNVQYNLFYGARHPLFWLTDLRILMRNGILTSSYYWTTGTPPNVTTHSSGSENNSGEKWIDLITPTIENTTRNPESHNNGLGGSPEDGYFRSNPAYKVGVYMFSHRATVGNPNASYDLNTEIKLLSWIM